MSDYLQALNPEQDAAVRHFEGPILVLAGAGSGKTRVLTSRIAHLVREHGVPAHRILAVTFTNKAAGEMRDRVESFLDGKPKGMWMGTFHAIGARILRRHAPRLGWSSTFSIFDAEQSLRLIKRTTESLGLDSRRWHPKAIRSHIGGAKNMLITPQQFVEDSEGSFDLFARTVASVYPAYQKALADQNAFDFDDLLVKPVELFQQVPDILQEHRERFSFVLVDEYQDTNHAQFRFLEMLSSGHRNLMVVGDDDQSIYGWRGADIKNILDFESSFPGAAVIRLEQNYRSTERILDAANAVIKLNMNRKGKVLRTERIGGDLIVLTGTADETDEARWVVKVVEMHLDEGQGVTYRDMSILYRTNAQARAMEDAFRRRAVPYQVVGGVRFYERREIQDILAYLRIISNPRDGVAFDRVVNYPRRGVGAASLERWLEWAEAEGIGRLEAANRAEEAPGVPPGGARGLKKFAELIQRFSAHAAQMRVGELLDELVEELDLVLHLRDEGPEGDDRADNVRELIAGALDFDAEQLEEWEEGMVDRFTELDLFLQRVALVAEVDRHDPDADAVTLMTLHNAKGLEFPVVFITGLEDGLFPLSRAYDDPAQLEEERRLFYVGLTRAQDRLFLTYARQRRRAGEIMFGRMSPFVDAIPDELLQVGQSELLKATTSYTRAPRRPDAAERPKRVQSKFEFNPLDSDVDQSFNQDLPRLIKGERVVHDTFGSGSVAEITGFGRDLKVVVNFESVGKKKLLVRHAGLKRDF